MAGTGKSPIAQTFAGNMEAEGLLGATFFVDRQVAERRDPHRIIQTLAYDLAERDHIRLHALWSSLRKKPTIKEMPLHNQVNALIKKPMEAGCSEPLLILIDGLDECTPSDGVRLLSALVTCLAYFPIKLFVACRTDKDIRKSFSSILPTEICLQDQPEEDVCEDVRCYWERSLDTLCLEHGLPDWRFKIAVKLLVDITGYLFIYATTILKIVQNTRGSPIKKLQELIEISASGAGSTIAFVGPDKCSPLEHLYTYILEEALKDNDGDVSPEYALQLHNILEVVIFAREPLTAMALAELLDMDSTELEGFLSTLLSVLVVPDRADELGVIRPFHQSFPDFVLGQGRHVHIGLAIDFQFADAHFVDHCLAVLIKKLRFNICNIQDPSLFNDEVPGLDSLLGKHVSAALCYACRYWAVHLLYHLRAAGSKSCIPAGLEKFCSKHLLHWIEVLSLTGAFSAVQQVMPMLLAAVKICDVLKDLDAGSLLLDAYLLMRDYHIPINLSALQVYFSGLLSMPECGLRTRAVDVVVGKLVSERHHGWRAKSPVCKDHTNRIGSGAYSPDGWQIISGSGDHTVRVWNSVSGVHKHILRGHTGQITSVTFSPDGSQIISGSSDHSVRVWDAVSGVHMHNLTGHTGVIISVMFSPDGSQIISASADHSMRVWNAVSGENKHTLRGHTSWITSVAFSSDGLQIISGSGDHTVRVWNSVFGEHKHTLRGHTNSIISVAFSPGDLHIISGSRDNTVRVWNAVSGQNEHTLTGHTDFIRKVVFSPDGLQIISGSGDHTVRVWDAVSGVHKHTLRGHTGQITSVALPPNGSQIISGSSDYTVRVWDAVSGVHKHTLRGHTGQITSVAFSPNGLQIISGSTDHILRLWDAVSGQKQHTLAGHSSYITSVAFSPNSLPISSGSSDHTLHLWDAVYGQDQHVVTSKDQHTLTGHSSYITSVAFSPDGSQTISCSDDGTMRVWDAVSGEVKHTLTSHSSYITSVSFSPDSSQIISSSNDNTVQVWDADSGTVKHTSTGNSHYITSVALSPNHADDSKVGDAAAQPFTVRNHLSHGPPFLNRLILAADAKPEQMNS